MTGWTTLRDEVCVAVDGLVEQFMNGALFAETVTSRAAGEHIRAALSASSPIETTLLILGDIAEVRVARGSFDALSLRAFLRTATWDLPGEGAS